MGKLLIVDDETFIRVLYKKEFENDGHEVFTASEPDDALKAVETHSPDLVILDIELENSNGLDLLNRLRQGHPNCAVILNSAYSTYKSDFQTWLADAYIMKSSDLKPLKETVQTLLAKGTCGKKT